MFANHDSVTVLTLLGVPVTLSSIGLLGVRIFFTSVQLEPMGSILLASTENARNLTSSPDRVLRLSRSRTQSHMQWAS